MVPVIGDLSTISDEDYLVLWAKDSLKSDPFAVKIWMITAKTLIMMMFSWVLAPCGLIGRFQRFEETLSQSSGLKWRCWESEGLYRVAGREVWRNGPPIRTRWGRDWSGPVGTMSLQPWRWSQYVSLKHWHLLTSPHGTRTQKNKKNCHHRENLKSHS
jgi:hypothetical protein